jgi:universal stress protein E
VLDHAVLRQATRLAGWIGARSTAVHAYLPVDSAALAAAAAGMPMIPPAGTLGDDMRQAASEAVAAVLAVHRYPPESVELVEGAATDVLPAWCVERAIDVLVVGVISRSRLVEAVLGSTAERLLDRIPSDLLAVCAASA